MAKQKSKNTESPESKASKIHDAFFKNTFSFPEIAKTYIQKFMDKELVENIDLESLTLSSTSFVTPELSEYFSDLVWEAKYKTTNVKVSFLFEHKSYVVPYPHVQLLRYIVEHWEVQIKAKEKLTVVIPIVIYHGDEGWKMRCISDYFEGIDEHLERFIPNFDYHFTNISGYSNEELIEMGIGKLLNVFLAMKHVRDKEYIKNNFSSLFIYAEQYLVGEESENFLRTIIVYLFKNSDIRGEELHTILNNIHSPLKDFTMSTYDMAVENGFKKGIEKGIEKGVEKGIDQKAVEVIQNLLTEYPTWSNEKIAQIAGVTPTFVQYIRDKK